MSVTETHVRLIKMAAVVVNINYFGPYYPKLDNMFWIKFVERIKFILLKIG